MGKLIDNEPNSGYVSPISICIERIRQDAEAEFEKNVLHAVLECGVAVDRDELIKALQYDRDQFRKGFAAGVEWAGPKWISVEDRLPEDDVRVLVSANSKSDDPVIAITHYTHRKYGYNIEGWIEPWQYFFYNHDITHWMPLPELPKEDEE